MEVGIEEEPDLQLLSMLVETGDLVVDVGANYGVYTRHLSELVGPEGHVVSVEPIPVTCSVLRKNVERHGWTNVEVHQVAASERNTELTMVVPEYSSGGENFYMAHVESAEEDVAERRFNVSGRTLDSRLADQEGEPSFIKIDVEGHELSTLKGATTMLRKCRPALLVETSQATQEVWELLARLGYREYVLTDGALKEASEPAVTRGPNHLFIVG